MNKDENVPDERTGVPEQCTLPPSQQPLRVAEFDKLFRTALRRVERMEPTRLRLVLDRDVEASARRLAEKESSCCSFFTFGFTRANGNLVLDVGVPASNVDVLDALSVRAESLRPALG